jgi:hypothetical protein
MKALQPIPEPVQEPVKVEVHNTADFEQHGKASKHGKQSKSEEAIEFTRNEAGDIVLQGEPELTAMEIAWREAQFKAKSRRQEQKARRKRSSDSEQDDILYRTLEHKSRSGSNFERAS